LRLSAPCLRSTAARAATARHAPPRCAIAQHRQERRCARPERTDALGSETPARRSQLPASDGLRQLFDGVPVELAAPLVFLYLALERGKIAVQRGLHHLGSAAPEQHDYSERCRQPPSDLSSACPRRAHRHDVDSTLRARTDIIVNPHARRFRVRPALVEELTALAGVRATVSVTPTLDELERVARAARERGSERVVLCGGDGTFMAGLSALARVFGERALPELVFAPAGTVATVARNWGHTRDLLETVKRVSSDAALPSELRPTLRIREPDANERLGFMFGSGLVARFFDRYYAAGAGGYPAAARIAARVFAGSFLGDAYSRSVLDPLPCVLSVDGRELEARAYSLVLASVVRDVGLHLWVCHRAGEDPERPHLVASALSPSKLGPQAPRVFLGKPLIGEGCFDGLVHELELRFAAEVGPYVLDGDVFHAKTVVVSAGPRIRVVSV
jgi:diacylglycerol kinase (ATP)